MERKRSLLSLNERLRLVLAGPTDKRQPERLEQVRQCREVLDAPEFRRLFEVDTTWGGFGERRQHYDEQLHVMGMTHFVPLERQTACNADDVTLLVTPIYRVLLSLMAITLKEYDFEGYGGRDLLLPYRPRIGTEVGRFISLLEVTCSVWLEVCHAYAREESPQRVEELYCLNVNRTRAAYVWIDYSSETCEAAIRYTSIASLSNPPCLVLSPGQEEEECDSALAAGTSFCLHSFGMQPWVELVGASPKISTFALLTRDGGHYVSFHRVVEGRIARYPLWFHLLDAEDASGPSRAPSCCVCGRRPDTLIEDPMDAEQGLLYCNRVCIQQMERVRHSKAREMEEAQALMAFQQGIPPGAK
jgi:hypothetical protein